MNYLVIKNNTIEQICTSIDELLEYLELSVSDKGFVNVGNIGQLPISYNMSEYTKEQVIRNVAGNQLKTIEAMLKIGIYKLERI